jgi:dihydroxy-acid dehydratase
VALLTDGRFSGGSHGFIVGHICPEAQEGGPIALVENGDPITIDAESKRIDLNIGDDSLSERRRRWQPPPLKVRRGVLHRYIKNVRPASEGCVTDE